MDDTERYPQISPAHDVVKLAKNLYENKKTGERQQLFIVEGLWAAQLLERYHVRIPYFLFCPELIKSESDQELTTLLCGLAEKSFTISSKVCGKISSRDGADGFFCICEAPNFSYSDIPLKDDTIIVIMDGLEQPGNIGAILRSLDGAGGDGAIVVNPRVKMTNSRLIRSSFGAAFTMPFFDAEMESLASWLEENNFTVYLTDLTAKEPYYTPDYKGPTAIVAGNEFRGISPVWRTYGFSRPIIIPMMGHCESLNVGFATTLVAYEARRKKTRKS